LAGRTTRRLRGRSQAHHQKAGLSVNCSNELSGCRLRQCCTQGAVPTPPSDARCR
jgi:hypothetical protein